MNPKQEFIKAIMQVLRLEANIYTMGAIEEIIDRLETPDYTLFIAYLGERESNYEKPIESIAKGVNEYYELKLAPLREASLRKSNDIAQCIYLFVSKSGRSVEEIVGKIFSAGTREIEITKEDFDLAISCTSYEAFKNSGFVWWHELQDEIYKKLMNGKIKPTIEEKIENKSIVIAQKTLGICVKALGLSQKQNRYVQ